MKRVLAIGVLSFGHCNTFALAFIQQVDRIRAAIVSSA